MRQKLVALCTVFFLLLFANPVWAGVNLNINEKSYVPTISLQLENGITMIPLYVVGRVLGAEIETAENIITVRKNFNTLVLSVGNTQATFNDQLLTMPKAPELVNGEVMVPLRFICETFGVTVNWQQQSQTVALDYSEQRQCMTVDELLLKSSEAMLKHNTYKTRVDLSMDMEVTNPTKPAETTKIDTTMQMDLAIQQEPLLVYGKTNINIPATPDTNGPASAMTEMLINEDGMFMTMPEQEGWLKINIPGMDMKELMKQSNSNDPVASLQMMQESGAIMSFGDDQEKDGQSYWVINVTLGADSFSKLFKSVMDQIPALPKADSGQAPADGLNEMMQALSKNMQVDMAYRVWVDQVTLVPTFMDLDATINMILPPTPTEDGMTGSIAMSVKETASYEIYDLGKPFTLPDVSQAVDMNEFMEKQMAAAQL